MRADGPQMRPMTVADAAAVIALLQAQRPGYLKDFFPFPLDTKVLAEQMENARQDLYTCILDGKALAGFWMLRGLDAGYERPSFGVFIDEARAGRGWGAAALGTAIQHCRQAGLGALMLKVAPDNAPARHIYEAAGFVLEARCHRTGHDIMALRLEPVQA
jgi:RimJ/RimL family protein N-acetyltransferase